MYIYHSLSSAYVQDENWESAGSWGRNAHCSILGASHQQRASVIEWNVTWEGSNSTSRPVYPWHIADASQCLSYCQWSMIPKRWCTVLPAQFEEVWSRTARIYISIKVTMRLSLWLWLLSLSSSLLRTPLLWWRFSPRVNQISVMRWSRDGSTLREHPCVFGWTSFSKFVQSVCIVVREKKLRLQWKFYDVQSRPLFEMRPFSMKNYATVFAQMGTILNFVFAIMTPNGWKSWFCFLGSNSSAKSWIRVWGH